MKLPRRSRAEIGDYVLASKYSDADPVDMWHVGFVYRIMEIWEQEKATKRTYFIADGTCGPRDLISYPCVRKITAEFGKEWLEMYGKRGFDPK